MVERLCRVRWRLTELQPWDCASGAGEGDRARSRAADEAESCRRNRIVNTEDWQTMLQTIAVRVQEERDELLRKGVAGEGGRRVSRREHAIVVVTIFLQATRRQGGNRGRGRELGKVGKSPWAVRALATAGTDSGGGPAGVQ
jgi:hypothetical protein